MKEIRFQISFLETRFRCLLLLVACVFGCEVIVYEFIGLLISLLEGCILLKEESH